RGTHQEALSLPQAAGDTRAVWSLANAYLAEAAPWRAIKEDRDRACCVARIGINLVRVAALVGWPFIPSAASNVLRSLGEEAESVRWPESGHKALTAIPAGRRFDVPSPLFPQITGEALTLP